MVTPTVIGNPAGNGVSATVAFASADGDESPESEDEGVA